ncbi:MAG: methyltransferase domain-containing protein [Desulfohalobiaceae bacterium]|nr:methyltransferase domain-containing protein [Desulfohalobiaceae bacterium]
MSDLHKRILEEIDRLSREEKIELLQQLETRSRTDSRRFQRRPFFLEVSYRDEQDRIYQDFVRDLSAGGLFLETTEPHLIGQEIQLNFSLPGLEEPLPVQGKIVRKRPGGVGVRFKQPFHFFQTLLHPKSTRLPLGLSPLQQVKIALKERLPDSMVKSYGLQKSRLQPFLEPLQKFRYQGKNRFCPVCENSINRFLPHYDSARPEARCPVCRSLERHRLDWIFFRKMTDLFSLQDKRFLHVAPEQMFEKRFRALHSLTYVTVDLKERTADVRGDLMHLPFPEKTFDSIYCSHVLEHVPDDRQALHELYQILKPSGWAVIQVPITAQRTREDSNMSDPLLRAKIFGQHDHLRRYGYDFKDRLEAAGFRVMIHRAESIIGNRENLARMGIQENRTVFSCRRQT